MSVQFPPRILTTRFLREQRARKIAFRAWFDEVAKEWPRGKVTTEKLHSFVAEYKKLLQRVEALNPREQGQIKPANSVSSKGYSIEGLVLWPIALGQNAHAIEDAYAEEAVLVSQVGAFIKQKRVSVFEAPLSLCLTRHALDRISERGAVRGELDAGLAKLLPTLLNDTSVTLALGMMKAFEQGDNWSRTAYVPLGEGLVVCTNRIVIAPRHSQDIGWRFDFTRRRYTPIYLKPELIQPYIDRPDLPTSYIGAGMWFVTTYLSPGQLTLEQRQYAEQMQEFLKRSSERLRAAAFGIQFDPSFAGRQSAVDAAILDVDEARYFAIGELLRGSSFASKPRQGEGFLLESDATTKVFRQMLASEP